MSSALTTDTCPTCRGRGEIERHHSDSRLYPFTPGPWRTGVGGWPQIMAGSARVAVRVARISELPVPPGSATNRGKEEFGNAKLIAAAPELLMACQEALGVLRGQFGETTDHPEADIAMRLLVAALAKAQQPERAEDTVSHDDVSV
jgi:hypothetical protein